MNYRNRIKASSSGRGGPTAKEEKGLYAQNEKTQAGEKGEKFKMKESVNRKLLITGLRADSRFPCQWDNCFTH